MVNIRFVVNNRKKNDASGQWEDDPVWIDIEVRNGFGPNGRKTADICEQYLKKGSQAFFEGHLKLDQWDDKTTGQKRQKLKVVATEMQMLDTKAQPQGSATSTGPLPEDARPVLDDNIPFSWLIFAAGLSAFLGGLV